jgi:hypothetical protein
MGHRPSTRTTVGEMLYDDFEPFKESRGVLWSVRVAEDSSWLTLNLSVGGLRFTALANDDTLIWRNGIRETEGLEITSLHPWSEFCGTELKFAWMMMNDQGYIDGALLGFEDAFVPSVALAVTASTIKVSRLGVWADANSR